MRSLPALALALGSGLLLLPPVLSAEPLTPKPDSKERADILAAVEDPIEDALHKDVTFKVNHLVIDGDWAFLDALPLTKDGKPMTYAGTMFEDWVEEADEVLWVLLRNKRGRWYIVEKVFFTTEATWAEWPKYFRAPPTIFPKVKAEE